MDIFLEFQNALFIKRLVAWSGETKSSPVFDLHVFGGPKVTWCLVEWIEGG